MNTGKDEIIAKSLALRPDLTFDNLVVTWANTRAVEYAKSFCRRMKIEEKVLKDENALHLKKIWDLVVFGDVGCGKTHLLRAMQNKLTEYGFSVFYADAHSYELGLMIPEVKKETEYQRQAREFIAKYPADVYIFDDFEYNIFFTPTQRFYLWIRQELGYKPVIIACDQQETKINEHSLCEEMKDYFYLTYNPGLYIVNPVHVNDTFREDKITFRTFKFGVNSHPDITLTEAVFKRLMELNAKSRYKVLVKMSKLGIKHITVQAAVDCWDKPDEKQ